MNEKTGEWVSHVEAKKAHPGLHPATLNEDYYYRKAHLLSGAVLEGEFQVMMSIDASPVWVFDRNTGDILVLQHLARLSEMMVRV